MAAHGATPSPDCGSRTCSGAAQLLIGIFALALCATGGAHAFLTSTDSAANALQVGYVTTSLEEKFTSPETVWPGDDIPKRVTVRNTGNATVFVRVFVKVTGAACEWVEWDIDTSKWVWSGIDGCFYYTTPLRPGQVTSPLMETATIPPEAPEEDVANFDVVVYEESVQAHGYSSGPEAFKALERSSID